MEPKEIGPVLGKRKRRALKELDEFESEIKICKEEFKRQNKLSKVSKLNKKRLKNGVMILPRSRIWAHKIIL